ncbi:MAG: AAA family ATPase [Candidatus Omnitrophica bacterium]|nr:AAA family ATPase [Candidatus Omnitrophota bacterium]
MYEEYWGLKEKPFENTPDPRFLYRSIQHKEALSRLFYVVREGKGAGMLTGIFGCGKTVLGHALLKELESDIYKLGFVTNPRLEAVELLRMIIHSLGREELPTRKTEVLVALNELLVNNLRDGKKTVIIIDEAHSIEEKEVFEEIRLLLNYQLEDKFLLTLLLLGQPELKEKIENNKQLLQRIAMRYNLEALSLKETEKYIYHRLAIAGSDGSRLFDIKSLKKIYQHSGGIPRRINQICDMSLLIGFDKRSKKINEGIVGEAVRI